LSRLAAVLLQCPVLQELHLEFNQIGGEGAGRLAKVLPQCPGAQFACFTGTKLLVQKYKY
jgi:hypothetical protein